MYQFTLQDNTIQILCHLPHYFVRFPCYMKSQYAALVARSYEQKIETTETRLLISLKRKDRP